MILYFRKRLLAYSETFLASQGKELKSHKALYLGLYPDKNGVNYIPKGEFLLHNEIKNSFLHKAVIKSCLFLGIKNKWLREISNKNPSLIHSHFGFDGIVGQKIANILKIPHVVTFYGDDICNDNPRKSYKKQRKKLFKQVDKVIAFSKFIENELIKKGCPKDKIIQHYTGADLSTFTAKREESPTPTVVFVGRFVEKKGVPYLINAFKEVEKQIPEAKLLFIGGGGEEAKMKELAKEKIKNYEFLGKKSPAEISDYLRKTSLFCGPSIANKNGDREGLGMVFIEAQALGVPVVSFKTGGIPEVVEHGVTGLLAEPNDTDTLANYLIDLLKDDKKRKLMGQKGRERVEKQFDIVKQTKLLEDIYDSLLR